MKTILAVLKEAGFWRHSLYLKIENPLCLFASSISPMPPRLKRSLSKTSPAAWGLGAHSKHLRNLYIYFWRWATWKVFDHGNGTPGPHNGIVSFITVAGFLSGPGFQRMRAYLRETCDDIWVIDCSPEGHQPEVNTRIFQGVQQPVCIVMASRSDSKSLGSLAKVRFRALPRGRREEKFTALQSMRLDDKLWIECPENNRAPFLPESTGAWADFPKLEDLFSYNGGGIQAKRTWVYAPDQDSLRKRWEKLIVAKLDDKEELFHPTLRNGVPSDRHIRSVVKESLPGFRANSVAIAVETSLNTEMTQIGFRSFDRQWCSSLCGRAPKVTIFLIGSKWE